MEQSHRKNLINTVFERKPTHLLSIYCTAGFPRLNDTVPIIQCLQDCGVDMIEIGIPFSDPIADGAIIQESSSRALLNGMTMETLFSDLAEIRRTVSLPLVLMGYLNPILQFGEERFFQACADVGIDGVIVPDLPLELAEQRWKAHLAAHGVHYIALITPQTPEARVRRIDAVSGGFVYAVSSAGTTGGMLDVDDARMAYFQRLKDYQERQIIRNPVMIGFGIHDKASFHAACEYANGAIIGSAFIKALSAPDRSPQQASEEFLATLGFSVPKNPKNSVG